jgi:hypothetical protein
LFLTKLDNKIQNQSDKVELLKERKKDFYRRCLCSSDNGLLCKLTTRKTEVKKLNKNMGVTWKSILNPYFFVLQSFLCL